MFLRDAARRQASRPDWAGASRKVNARTGDMGRSVAVIPDMYRTPSGPVTVCHMSWEPAAES